MVYPLDSCCIYESHMDIDDSRACVNLFDKGGGSGNISVALDN